MNSEREDRIIAELRSRAETLGLEASAVTIRRVLNWGGFVAYSYTVSDGGRIIHLKLTTEHNDLERWLAVRDLLERDYRAPRILDWIEITGTSLGGLAFEHLPGATWDPITHPGLLCDLQSLLERLHGDRALADRIGGEPRTYRACWNLRYRDQYEQDLRTIFPCRPAFVTDDRLAWMEQEAHQVLGLAADHPAFDGQTRAPCHWDLWENNVMVAPTGEWWVLDWDSLAIGDEAEDHSTLVWAFVTGTDRDWREFLPEVADPAFEARMDLHLRAMTLDYLIDVLADWAECDIPEWQADVRCQKEAQHHQWYDWYRSRWG